MFCIKCGTPNSDTAYQCSQCGESFQSAVVGPQGGMMPEVPTRLVPAILVTLFCCMPFGIVAIVYAAQVSAKVSAGDVGGAMISSGKAKFWCWLAFGLGLISTLLSFGFMAVAGLTGIAHGF